MPAYPEPEWPLLVLAVIQVVDAILCIGPAPFVRECLEAVHLPRRMWPLLTPLKLAAAAGLVGGLWVPYFGLVTCAALVAYFLIAIGMHLRARDLGSRLFVNASGMLVLSLATG
ncbi:DoxX family protein [Aeromicrobium sp.]|uniref:DoxX family protein n=1 Tax=Aeromicrobium sp. TaxID=1871063 RepID=UPI003D6B90C2